MRLSSFVNCFDSRFAALSPVRAAGPSSPVSFNGSILKKNKLKILISDWLIFKESESWKLAHFLISSFVF